MKYITLVIVFVALIAGILISAPVLAQDDWVRIQGDQFTINGQITRMKGTNYYPRDYMWASMWNNWDWNEITSESDKLKAAGLNCVRILVPYQHGWNGPNVNTTYLQHLEDLVNLLGGKGIRSLITLFDWETSWPIEGSQTETDHIAYMRTIMTRFADNKYVLLWDLKNEPDHPDNIGGYDDWDRSLTDKAKIVSWIRRMYTAAKGFTSRPVSVGIRWYTNVDDVLDYQDVAIYHSYSSGMAESQITTIKGYLSGKQTRPILCEEFGWPTNPTPYNDKNTPNYQDFYGFTENDQLGFITAHINAFKNQKIGGCLTWQASDACPYTTDKYHTFEDFFGLWRYDYSLKPAGIYYRDNYPIIPPDQFPPAPVKNLCAYPGDSQVKITWTNPTDIDFKGARIVSKLGGYPTSATDGTVVIDKIGTAGAADYCIASSGVGNANTYYYGVFAFDNVTPTPNYATPATISCMPFKVTCADARKMQDGNWTYMKAKTVTANFNSDGYIYVEEPDRTSGIRVAVTSTYVAGTVVNVTGTISTRIINGQSSEKIITSATASKKTGSTVTPIKPLFINNASVGGGTINNQIPGVQNGSGLNNIGLLVMVYGKVTYSDTSCFYVDDGSGLEELPGKHGVMVKCSFIPGVSIGNKVSVIGVVEGNIPDTWTTNNRCIRARSISDIKIY